MAWLFRARPPLCAESGCTASGAWKVRSILMHQEEAPDLAPRCLRHARKLEAQYTERETAAGLDRDGFPLEATAE